MKFSFTINGNSREASVGYSISVAASEFLREKKKAKFQENTKLITETLLPDQQGVRLLEELNRYSGDQFASDEEIRAFLFSAEGMLFTLKKSAGLSDEEAKAAFDSMDEDKQQELVFSISYIIDGKNYSDALRRDYDNRKAAAKSAGDSAGELLNALMVVCDQIGVAATLTGLAGLLPKEEKRAEDLPGQKKLDFEEPTDGVQL